MNLISKNSKTVLPIVQQDFLKENIEIEDVNRKITHITIGKLKMTNNETLHRKLNIWQHELH